MTVCRLQSADEMQSGIAADSELLLCLKSLMQNHESFRHCDDLLNQRAFWVQSEFVPQGIKCGDKQYVGLLNNLNKHVKDFITQLSALKAVRSLYGLIKEEEVFERLRKAYDSQVSDQSSFDQRYKHGVGQDKEEVAALCSDDLEGFKAVVSPESKYSNLEDLIGVWESFETLFIDYEKLHKIQQVDLQKLKDCFCRSDFSPNSRALLRQPGLYSALQGCLESASYKKVWLEKSLLLCRAELGKSSSTGELAYEAR